MANSQFSSIQASRILIQLAKTSKEIYHFYDGIQKQIYDVHMFTHHVIDLCQH
jgi:hypothetical protein